MKVDCCRIGYKRTSILLLPAGDKGDKQLHFEKVWSLIMTSYRFSQETFVLFTSTFLTFKGITNIELFQEAFQ